MKPFMKLAAITCATVIVIYFFVGQTQRLDSDNQVKTEITSEANPKVAPETILLAEIDGQKITGADFNQYLELFKKSGEQQSETPAMRERQVKNLINRNLLLEEARKNGYFENEDLKKHGSLNSSEHETIVLRQFLTDRISRPATIADTELELFIKSHPNFTPEQAREHLTSKRQQQLFQKLMHDLKNGHKIVIHQKNLTW